MKQLHIITPVKDSIELTLQTIESILSSDFAIPYHYYVYNDFSTDENTARLREASEKMGFELINLSDLTDHPSPNYLPSDCTAKSDCRRCRAFDRRIGRDRKEAYVAVAVRWRFDASGLWNCRRRNGRRTGEYQLSVFICQRQGGQSLSREKAFELLLFLVDRVFLEGF